MTAALPPAAIQIQVASRVVGGAPAFSSVGFPCLLAPILALTAMASGAGRRAEAGHAR